MEGNSRLPWEPPPGSPPEAVGICLSGGGLRAAAYSLGVLQGLQAERGLLWGSSAADHLAVVSGGSYIGATLIGTAASAPPDQTAPPLEEGSPEADHVVTHGRYLVEEGGIRFAWRVAWRAALGVGAMLLLLCWVAVIVSIYHRGVADHIFEVPAATQRAFQAVIAGGTVFALARIARGTVRAGGVLRIAEPLFFILVLTATLPSFFAFTGWIEPLRLSTSLTTRLVAIGMVVVTLVAAAAFGALARWRRGSILGWVAGLAGSWLARALGLAIFIAAATIFDRAIAGVFATEGPTLGGVVAIVIIFAAPLADLIAQRVPLHRMYRSLLGRCFAVSRDGDAARRIVPENALMLSALRPAGANKHSFPRLLVCATANVTVKNPSGKTTRFSPFVFSYDRIGVPGMPGASFATVDLERGRNPAGAQGNEPMTSLMDAVACTGAAISPSMGHDAIPGGRPLISVINVRLGQSYPNPHSSWVRSRVSQGPSGRLIKDRGLGYGFGQLVQDLFGLQPGDGKWIYVSDGGHYDNLGLMTLLRARCKEIWCVDCDADPAGNAKTLKAVLELARTELGVSWNLDLEAFRPTHGDLPTAHAAGNIHYKDGGVAQVRVIKLGFTSETGADLRAYAGTDRRFPYHPTWIQWYARPRFDAYRKLGMENAIRACRD